LKDNFQGNLVNIDNLLFNLSDAVQNIPITKKKKDSNKKDEELLEEDEPLDEEIRDKILRFVRDYIISKNYTVRKAFDIES
jgi:hypothetical protein